MQRNYNGCLSVSTHQRVSIHVEDQKPLLHSAYQNYSRAFTETSTCFPGVSRAYSEDAALKAYPNCESVPCDDYEAAFKAVELWLVDKEVLPIENHVDGSTHRNYDLLLRNRLKIVGEVQQRVIHCLLGLPGVTKEELNNVMSHPQDAA
ncbi:hypothetical protein RYX36_006754 [Vicia faba]